MILSDFITKFEAYLLTERRVAQNTLMAYQQDLRQFQTFCKLQNIVSPDQVGLPDLKQFLSYLKDRGIAARSLARKIASIKGLFSYGASRYGFTNHAQELQSPKLKKTLPKALSEEEVGQLFQAANEDLSPIGKRNSIMLYIMYVTGMRVSELISLKTHYVHRDTALVAIEGKGGRQRMIPIPDSMMTLLTEYMDGTRPSLLKKLGNSDFLFPVVYGKKVKAMSRQGFWIIVKQLWKKAKITRPMSPHTLRHSFATHMLQQGANLRSLQILLGHEQLNTVQIYTKIDTSYLRDIYNKKHPRS